MNLRGRVTAPEGGEVRTVQAPRAETDVNTIVRRFVQTGVPPPLKAGDPWYGDFSNMEDYLAMRLRLVEAQRAFDALPARVRQAVDNSPAELIKLISDPERRAEAIELGLVEEPEPEPTPEPAPEPAPAGAPAGQVAGG